MIELLELHELNELTEGCIVFKSRFQRLGQARIGGELGQNLRRKSQVELWRRRRWELIVALKPISMSKMRTGVEMKWLMSKDGVLS